MSCFLLSGNTADPQVKLVKGNVECNTVTIRMCRAKIGLSRTFSSRQFRGALCLACHDPNRVVNGNVNYLVDGR